MGQIYRLDFSNGKSYIGLTVHTAKYRFKKHENDVRNGSTLMVHAAWRKHGAPKVTILAIVERCELAATEIRAIRVFNTLSPNGYNLSTGGDMSPTLQPHIAAKVAATKRTPEARKRASIKAIEVMSRPEVKAKMKAIQCTPEARKRSSDRLAAMWENPTYRDQFMRALHEQVISPETRAKISATLRTPEVAALISRKGWHHSNASRLQISASTKGIPKQKEAVLNITQGATTRWLRDGAEVQCVETGAVFANSRCAADWLIAKGLTKSKYAKSSVWNAADKNIQHLGHHWVFTNKKELSCA